MEISVETLYEDTGAISFFPQCVCVSSSWIWARIIPTLICCKTLTLKCSLHQLQWINMLAICWDVPMTSQMAVDIYRKEAIRSNTHNSKEDGHLLDWDLVSVLERVNKKRSKDKQWPTLGVHLTEVSAYESQWNDQWKAGKGDHFRQLSVIEVFFQRGLPLELIHDMRHLNSKMSEIKIMSHDLSKTGRGGAGKQQVKTANTSNCGRVCLLQATNYEEIVISKTTTQGSKWSLCRFRAITTNWMDASYLMKIQ